MTATFIANSYSSVRHSSPPYSALPLDRLTRRTSPHWSHLTGNTPPYQQHLSKTAPHHHSLIDRLHQQYLTTTAPHHHCTSPSLHLTTEAHYRYSSSTFVTTPGEMDIRSILVKTLDNEYFSLQDDPERATTTLEEDGCVLLKGSTTLDVCQEAMNQCYNQRGDERCRSEHGALGVDSIMECITREVTLNRAVAHLLFSKYNSFLVSPQMAMVHWAQISPFEGMKRIDGAPSYVSGKGFTLVNCTHFGGDSSVVWGLSVVLGSHKNTSGGDTREIEACGGDILIFNGALLRSLPRLIHSTPERSFTVQVLYWRGDRPPIAGVKEGFRKRIVELGGDDCRERTDNGFTNVEWAKKAN